MRRGNFWRAAAGALTGATWLAAGLVHPTGALAQNDAAANYPSGKPIRLVVGFAAGGGNDIIARILAEKLQQRLGGSVFVENKPGAGGRLSAELVAREAPDGYNLLVGASGAMSIAPAIYERLNYNTLKDFSPIAMIADYPLMIVVAANHPAKTVAELVAFMKANPDKSNYATSSPSFTVATELFKLKTGAPSTAIPYKGSGESVVSVIAGQSLLTICDPGPAAPLVKGGQLRALAVTASKRMEEFPDVPTLAEVGITGADVALYSGLFAPAATPPAIVKKLEAEVRAILTTPDVKQRYLTLGMAPSGMPGPDFAKRIDTEIKSFTEIAKAANIKGD